MAKLVCARCESDEAKCIRPKDEPEYAICAECGYDEFEELYQCKECEDYFPENSMSGEYCSACSDNIMQRFYQLFTPDERDTINKLFMEFKWPEIRHIAEVDWDE